jgi:hypothetical protein
MTSASDIPTTQRNRLTRLGGLRSLVVFVPLVDRARWIVYPTRAIALTKAAPVFQSRGISAIAQFIVT